MSWTAVGPDISVKGRKVHQCDVCRGRIAHGEVHMQRTGVEDGEGFYTVHMHNTDVDDCYKLQQSSSWSWED